MKAILSLLFGISAFVTITGTQLNLLIMQKLYENEAFAPRVFSISWGLRIFVIALGGIAIFTSILYLRTYQKKYKILSLLGLILGVISIILSFIPFYLFIN